MSLAMSQKSLTAFFSTCSSIDSGDTETLEKAFTCFVFYTIIVCTQDMEMLVALCPSKVCHVPPPMPAIHWSIHLCMYIHVCIYILCIYMYVHTYYTCMYIHIIHVCTYILQVNKKFCELKGGNIGIVEKAQETRFGMSPKYSRYIGIASCFVSYICDCKITIKALYRCVPI